MTTSPTSDETTTEEAPSLDTLRKLYPGVPDEALLVYQGYYVDLGPTKAWAEVRADSRYEQWFPGNLTADGSVRYSEAQYANARESYRDVLRSAGIANTDLFEDRITQLMQGEVSPDEFAARVTQVYDRIVSRSDEVKKFYAEHYGMTGLDTASLLAAALDPTVGDLILSGQIAAAEVGGQAAASGYTFSLERIEELVAEGMTWDTAGQIFKEAETLVPILDTLAKRHNDPDDDFDIEEFLAADFFKDPMQNLRMRRMMSAERSLFSRGAGYQEDRYGGVSGLVAD